MMKILKIKLILLLLFIPFIGDASSVYVSHVDGEIKAGTVQYLQRAVTTAEEDGASYFVIKLDTPGGLVDSTKKIADSFMETEMSVVVFVYKEGGWAYSAGAFLLLASDHAFAHPTSSIGAAEPRDMEGDTKIIESMSSWIGQLASSSGRDSQVAERFVRENLVLSGEEALSLGLVDGVAESLDEVLQGLGVVDAEVVYINPSFLEKVFDALSHPYLVSLFLSLGALSLFLAIRTGEIEISGALGLILLLMGLWGIGVINFTALGTMLILLGLLLLAVEVFISPGFGITGALGVTSLVIGVFNFGAEPLLATQMFDFVSLFTIGILLVFFALFFIIGRGLAFSFSKEVVTGPDSMVGQRGVVVRKIEGFGRVAINQEIWTARSDEVIEEGKKVEVVSLKGNTLEVKKKVF